MGLNRNQKRSIPALLKHATVKDAADAVGLHRVTLSRYLGDPEFQAAMSEAIDAESRGLTASLAGAAERAVAVVLEILDDTSEAGYVRLQAARVVLQYRNQSLETQELVDRIERLENSLLS